MQENRLFLDQVWGSRFPRTWGEAHSRGRSYFGELAPPSPMAVITRTGLGAQHLQTRLPIRRGLFCGMFWPVMKTSPAISHLPVTLCAVGSAGLALSPCPASYQMCCSPQSLSAAVTRRTSSSQVPVPPTGTLSAWSVSGGEWHADRLRSCRHCRPLHSPPLLATAT